MLESIEVITKRKLPGNKKENIYLLTEKGMDLAPIILELVLWSDKHVRAYHPEMNAYENQNLNKKKFIEGVQKEYRKLVSQIID
jgi:DNA-binding HxlR family transcriptional regulator